MSLHNNLRTALVTIGLFSAAMAGHAHQQAENVSKLLNSPVAQQAAQAPDVAELAKSFLNNPSDKMNLDKVAGPFKMAPTLMSVSMERTVSVLKLHLQPQDQETALKTMLASSFNQKANARTLLKQMPKDNVITEAVAQVLEFEELLSSPANWTAFNLEMFKAPKFNVQNTLAQPGVKTLQSILENKCAIPKTSVSVLESNAECASDGSTAAKNVTLGLMESKLTDGLIVGDYEGVPVLVMHDSAGAQGTAGVFRLNEMNGRPATPFIVISMELVNALKDKPDAMAFIMEHELGHVEHKHVMGETDKNEVPADSSAVEHLSKKGMSTKQIAAAYTDFVQATVSILPQVVKNNPSFLKMMSDRQQNVESALRSIQTNTREATSVYASYGG